MNQKRGQIVKPTTVRIIGIVLLVAAAVIAVLNLKRVANLGVGSFVGVLVVLGVLLVVKAKKQS
jgi:hypothetical protein